MELFTMPVQVRWADLDPNFHLRHSVYYDWAALCRIEYLNGKELTPALYQRLHIGPILFREECIFRKEIKFGDSITINLKLIKSRRDFSRWTIAHEIKKDNNILSAVVTVDGAWIDVIERKLAVPPAEIKAVFENMPVDENFIWEA
jgi:acyl-CoA thioester hydrolase